MVFVQRIKGGGPTDIIEVDEAKAQRLCERGVFKVVEKQKKVKQSKKVD
jgi:hypothetical protein